MYSLNVVLHAFHDDMFFHYFPDKWTIHIEDPGLHAEFAMTLLHILLHGSLPCLNKEIDVALLLGGTLRIASEEKSKVDIG